MNNLNTSILNSEKIELFSKVSFLLIIISDFYLSYVDIGPYPPRNYITAFVSLFILFDLKNKKFPIFLKKYSLSFLYIFIILFYLLLQYLVKGNFLLSLFKKDLLKFGTLFISMQFILEYLDFKFIKKSLYLVTLITFTIAIFQFFDFELAWKLRELLDHDSCKLFCLASSRPSGLAYYTLTLAEQLLIVTPFITLELFGFSTYSKKRKVTSLLTNLAFFAGILIINNRVNTLSYLLSLIYITFISFKNRRRALFTSLTGIAILSLIVSSFFRLFTFIPSSDLARFEALMGSIHLVKENFFLGLGDKLSHLKDLLGELKTSTLYFSNFKTLGNISPHNSFINLHLKLGLLGTTLNVFAIARLIRISHPSKLFLIATVVNSLTHNSGYFLSSASAIGLTIFLSIKSNLKLKLNDKKSLHSFHL